MRDASSIAKVPKRIGVFDSGAGGLTVTKSLIWHRLFDEIIYYGDTARVPYGTKDANTVIRYALEAVEFFKNFDIDLLVTACNTVSAHAIAEVRESAPFPVVGVIDPGIEAIKLRNLPPEAEILVLGTRATIQSGRYQLGLRDLGFSNITALAPSLFVPIVEEGLFEGDVLDSALHHYFSSLKTPDAIILGCTHFPLIEIPIGRYFGDKPIMIHSGEAISQYLINHYACRSGLHKPELKIFASENPDALKAIASDWLFG